MCLRSKLAPSLHRGCWQYRLRQCGPPGGVGAASLMFKLGGSARIDCLHATGLGMQTKYACDSGARLEIVP